MPLTTSLSEAVSGCDVHQRERTEGQVSIHSCECSSTSGSYQTDNTLHADSGQMGGNGSFFYTDNIYY